MSSRNWLIAAWAIGGVSVTGLAGAHHYLHEPPAWQSQDELGSPQKGDPCGEDGPATPSGIVTPYTQGETIDVVIEETIYHPGHYRVVLAVNDRSELPPSPVVTPDSNSPCGTAEIQNPPVFPVLVDGALVHDSPIDGLQTIKVTLPSDVTCEKCTLQILEFMSDHELNDPGGCFYKHCADISISPAGTGGAAGGSSGGGTSSGGASSGGGSGNTGGAGGGTSGTGGSSIARPPSDEGSCGCELPRKSTPGLGAATAILALAGLAFRRRRSR
jgi:MYXO-CTERM domain-containing protein